MKLKILEDGFHVKANIKVAKKKKSIPIDKLCGYEKTNNPLGLATGFPNDMFTNRLCNADKMIHFFF